MDRKQVLAFVALILNALLLLAVVATALPLLSLQACGQL